MPTWKEHLDEINALRMRRKHDADQLYKAQIQLNTTNALLDRIEKNETTLSANQEQIAALRSEIERLLAQVREINGQLNEINTLFDRIKQNEGYLGFLQKKIEVVTAQLNDAIQNLHLEESKQVPDKKIMDSFSNLIDQLEELSSELRKDIEAARSKEETLKNEQGAALSEQKRLQDLKNNLQKQIGSREADLAGLLQQDNNNYINEILGTQGQQQAIYEQYKMQLDLSTSNLSNAIGKLYFDEHPGKGILNLDDNIPFLLLPVRIETRFIYSNDEPELWIRIYPDDIAIHTHEQLLTDDELKKGIAYWKALYIAEKKDNTDKEDLKKGAWNDLALTFSPQRAAYIALQTKPTNWNNLSEIDDVDKLAFPSFDLTKNDAWSRAPRVNVLPDRFVVSFYEGDVMVKEVVGKIIPDELYVGPDPMEPADSFVTKDEKLVFGNSFDWASDFDRAISNGMGFKYKLNPTQAVKGFDKIVVLGVYLSSNETSSKKMVEELIDNHHYSPKGFSLVPQGSATNNTDNNGSEYTKNDPLSHISYIVESGTPLFTDEDDCDGKNLADALGIDYTPLQNIMHSDRRDLNEAVAMNIALYPSTLGYYFDTMLDPVLSDVQKNKVRDFFIDHVTGRGPLPAIRVGNQPYGILLTSDFDQWKWEIRRPNIVAASLDGSFLDGLYAILKNYNEIWNGLLNQLAFVGKPGSDPSDILMNIIGLQPNSASIYQRIGYSTDYLKNLDDFQYSGKYHSDLVKAFTSKNNALNFLQKFGYAVDAEGELRVPQLLRLIYQHYHTTLDVTNIIDDVPLSETEVITYYDGAAKKNYINWLADINNIDILEKQNFGTGKTVPTALLYLQLRRSLSLQLHKSSVLWFSKNNLNLDFALKASNFQNIRPGGDLSKWELMRAPVSSAVPTHPQKNKPISDYLLTTGKNEEEAAFLNSMKRSLSILAKLPTARLERCFIEHLDTCNYRLDAWQTGMFQIRLLQQRQLANKNRQKGIYLGAYGWVENIRPAAKQTVPANSLPEKLRSKNNQPIFEYSDNGGFVQAPSLNHASAAAVLRSGYMSHATQSNPDVMAVNLSSERVRKALFILEGMRNGQSLEALLGYQFERGLHDRGSANDVLLKLNLYIYDFRAAFPLQYHLVRQEGTNGVLESIPANNVVNGVTLAENTSAFPYGAQGNVLTASLDERNAIIEEKDKLSDTLDAVKDLLSAESIYQLVRGNFERCSALVNAVKDAIIPPELEVIHTPRGSQFTFTNRVTIHFESLDALNIANNPWKTIAMTPRAKMEAGMNKWIGKILGDPDKIIYMVSSLDNMENELEKEVMTVEQLDIQPIDIVYITGDELDTGAEGKTSVSELESRIAYQYRRSHGLEDTVKIKIAFMQPVTEPGKQNLASILPLLRQLRLLITDSRYIHAKDFDPDSKQSHADINNPKALDDVELLARVQQIQSLFRSNMNLVNGVNIQAEIPDPDANNLVTVYDNLKDAFDALNKAKLSFSDVSFTFTNANGVSLQEALIGISKFGVQDAFPKYSSVLTDETKAQLLEQARSIIRKMTETDKSVTEILGCTLTDIEKRIAAYIQAGKLILQESFNILPLFTFNNEPDVQLSHGESAELLKHAIEKSKMQYPVDEWMQNASHVRPRLARWDQIRSLYELSNADELTLEVVQLPYRTKDSWLSVEFPEKDKLSGKPFNIVHDTLSIVTHGEGTFTPAAKRAGLLIDDWTEMIPTNSETTGITFNYNQPNALPPQALLLAVTPEIKGHWTWDDLMGILNDTLHRAKLRAVEPQLLDNLIRPEVNVLRPALLADFTQYDLNVALDYRMNLLALATALPLQPVMAIKR